MRILSVALAVALLLPALAGQDDAYPSGRSQQRIEGLDTTLDIPDGLGAEKRGSLVLLLHGLGGSGKSLSTLLRPWSQAGYVICAPKSTGRGWNTADVKKVVKIAHHVMKKVRIDPDRIHVIGYSNGGWNLPTLAFDASLRPRSAIYVGAGHQGPSPPRWARKRLGAIAVAGAEDPNAPHARATPKLLDGRVRHTEVRLQPGLGHKWPRDHIPYMLWYTGVMEGRFSPGEDMNFAWTTDLAAALASQKESKKRGGVLLYVYDREDEESELARELQGGVFMDRAVRFYGSQVAAVKLTTADELPAAVSVRKAPAVFVLTKHGKVKKSFQGKVKAKALASALKSIAPVRKLPKL